MFTLNCKGRLLVVDKPVVMGIINTTPDSFYRGSRYKDTDSVLKVAEQMLNEGATILDIGGQSSRPGAVPVRVEEEMVRVIEPIRSVSDHFPEAFVSIDSFNSKVIRYAVEAGASIVNDISAGKIDPELISTVASLNVPYVLMHMKGEPATMQQNPVYENISREILDFFIREKTGLNQKGIKDIIIDPGFGFGKTIAQNFELLNHLEIFKMMGAPILLGISRKSTIYKTLGVSADDALNGTTVLNTIGLMKGASILRVHDVKEAAEAVKLFVQLN